MTPLKLPPPATSFLSQTVEWAINFPEIPPPNEGWPVVEDESIVPEELDKALKKAQEEYLKKSFTILHPSRK